jgi:cytidine deaminase
LNQPAENAMATVTHLARQLPSPRVDWQELAAAAWGAANHAMARNTAVGAAVLSSGGRIFSGCNVEHKLRCHDVHAEVNALSSMVAAGDHRADAIMVVSAGRCLTPCGGCLDWIFQLGGAACLIAWQGDPSDEVNPLRADKLMPHYPY